MLTAAALAAVVAHGAGVTQLAGETVVAVHHFTVDHDTGTYAGTQGDHDEVLHTAGCAVGHFTHGGGVGVVGEGHGNSVHLLAQELGEGNDLGATPDQVHGALDSAGVVVAVRGTYADSADAAFGPCLSDDVVESLCQFGDVGSYVGKVVRADNGLGENGATGIYDAAFGGLSTDVNAYY